MVDFDLIVMLLPVSKSKEFQNLDIRMKRFFAPLSFTLDLR